MSTAPHKVRLGRAFIRLAPLISVESSIYLHFDLQRDGPAARYSTRGARNELHPRRYRRLGDAIGPQREPSGHRVQNGADIDIWFGCVIAKDLSLVCAESSARPPYDIEGHVLATAASSGVSGMSDEAVY